MLAGETVLGEASWHFPDVICGHADPMHFAVDIRLDDALFAKIDRVELSRTSGESLPCG